MNSPRRGSLTSVFFWLSFFIIALLVIATSTVATRVYHVDAIRDLEVVAAAPDSRDAGPEAPRLAGRVLVQAPRVALPHLEDVSQAGGFKRVRFRIDLDRYLERPTACCEIDADGGGIGGRRPPG